MKPRYSKRTVDEAVQLLDCYASQTSDQLFTVADHLGASQAAIVIALAAWTTTNVRGLNMHQDAAEAAQRLREGWRP